VPRQTLDRWNDVLLREGGHLDVSRVPLPQPAMNDGAPMPIYNLVGVRVKLLR